MGNILLIMLFLLGSTFLFWKAAGTLNPGKLNIVSYVYFIFLLQSFSGAALLALGYDEQYTFTYLLNKERTITITVWAIWLTSILLPLMMLLWQKVMRLNMNEAYSKFLKEDTRTSSKEGLFSIFFGLGVLVCVIFMVGYLIQVGYIPVLRLFSAPEGFDFGTERVRISGIYFINSYLNNIILFTVIPILSYVSFAYMLATKDKKWAFIFVVMFCMSCICKTYKFEKSPIVFHILVFVLIYILFKGGIKFLYMAITGCVMCVILVFTYLSTGYSGTFLDIYSGPLGRILFTQVGTLSYHFELFPQIFGYLNGRSFSPTVLKLIGMGAEEHLRSAKLVMGYYGSEKVYDGVAGVMNTVFIGEAYANWGYIGVLFSIIWVALVISALMYIILKMKKTPTAITMMAIMTVRMGTMLEGGFCDFVYSFDIIFTCMMLIAIYVLFESDIEWKTLFANIREGVKGKKRNVPKNN